MGALPILITREELALSGWRGYFALASLDPNVTTNTCA